jgi:hypothetical protein
VACAEKALILGTRRKDFKSAEAAANELEILANTPKAKADAHTGRAELLLVMGTTKKKSEYFDQGVKEADAAMLLNSEDKAAMFIKGECLASAQQDVAAKQVFEARLPRLPKGTLDAGRVARFAENPELVRAPMAPAFSVTRLTDSRSRSTQCGGRWFWSTSGRPGAGPAGRRCQRFSTLRRSFKGSRWWC